jgi:hypothetical protein
MGNMPLCKQLSHIVVGQLLYLTELEPADDDYFAESATSIKRSFQLISSFQLSARSPSQHYMYTCHDRVTAELQPTGTTNCRCSCPLPLKVHCSMLHQLLRCRMPC